MSEYKDIPEWKKKILAKNGKNKRDRSKILRNQHKPSLLPIIKKKSVSELILQADNKEKLVKEQKKKDVEIKNKGVATNVGKLVNHFETLILEKQKKQEKNKN